jgi:Raf kinase inhibitor-like YbhB/YbcL family protein
MNQQLGVKLLVTLSLILASFSQAMELKSGDVKSGSKIGNDFVYQGMGCTGKNLSPELHWSGAPKDTKSFAITVYDPKAPTGSGWWHWVLIDIPASTTSLKQGWKASEAGFGREMITDFGSPGYGGPCPPPGPRHPYIFTVHALKTEKLDLPDGATHAFARFLIEANTLKKASFTAYYGR